MKYFFQTLEELEQTVKLISVFTEAYANVTVQRIDNFLKVRSLFKIFKVLRKLSGCLAPYWWREAKRERGRTNHKPKMY